jgi:prepilin-type N-terminal cleavage/methylation domain-containing protein
MTCMRPLPPLGRRGFSMAEVLIVLVIAGLVLAMAGPKLTGYLRSLTARSTTVQVSSDLALARTQAVREGRTVSFRVVSASRYQVTVDDAAGNPVQTVKTVDVSGPQHSSVLLSPVGGRVAFDSRGMLRNDNNNTAAAVVVSRGTQVDSITISAVGRVYRARNY